MKKILLWAFYALMPAGTLFAQQSSQENALLWKVTGKQLKKPTYLFGTYHFLTNAFIDTLPAVKQAYQQTDMVVGELIIDSSLQKPMMEAAVLKGTTLKEVLPDTLYTKAAAWFKQEAGMDLTNLNQFNPMMVMTVAMMITQQKYFPNKPGEIQLDTYFQQQGTKDGKKLKGLETVEIQVNALFKQLTIERQAALLNDLFSRPESLQSQLEVMNNAYIRSDMDKLQSLMYEGAYRPEEMKVMLDDRNSDWLRQLPALMKDQSLFVAVGALHLTGKAGLVQQLKSQGYTVTPVNLKKL